MGFPFEKKQYPGIPSSHLKDFWINYFWILIPALSSAPLSAMSTAPVSPALSPQHCGSNKLDELIPTFGGFDLKTCKILPMSLLKSWTVQLVKAVIDLHSRLEHLDLLFIFHRIYFVLTKRSILWRFYWFFLTPSGILELKKYWLKSFCGTFDS